MESFILSYLVMSRKRAFRFLHEHLLNNRFRVIAKVGEGTLITIVAAITTDGHRMLSGYLILFSVY